MTEAVFVEPDWSAPLDVESFVAGIPATAMVKGVFPAAVAAAARRRGLRLVNVRPRYHAFVEVPLREYVPMLVQASAGLYPTLTPRQALRKLGRASYDAFATSMFGRVLLSGIVDMKSGLQMVSKGLSIVTPAASSKVIEMTDGRALMDLSAAYTFIDSHHVGVFEKVASTVKTRVTVRVSLRTPYDGQVEVTW
jgi:uncharacterized protein (TIGR02265 family)